MGEKIPSTYALNLTRETQAMVYSALVVLADTKRRASVNHRFSDDVKAAFARELREVEALAAVVGGLLPQ